MIRIIAGLGLLLVIAVVGYAVLQTTDEGGSDEPEARFEIRGRDTGYFESKNGYLAAPAQEGTYPGVIIVHDSRGLDGPTRAEVEQLATRGYRAFAVDLFGSVAATSSDADRLVSEVDRTKVQENLRAAEKFLRDQGAKKVGIVGYGFGASQSMDFSLAADNLDATVMFYGMPQRDQSALRNIDWPVLGIFGAGDTTVTESSAREFETALKALDIENEIYVYPNLQSGFAQSGTLSYSAVDASDAREKMYAFLRKHLK